MKQLTNRDRHERAHHLTVLATASNLRIYSGGPLFNATDLNNRPSAGEYEHGYIVDGDTLAQLRNKTPEQMRLFALEAASRIDAIEGSAA